MLSSHSPTILVTPRLAYSKRESVSVYPMINITAVPTAVTISCDFSRAALIWEHLKTLPDKCTNQSKPKIICANHQAIMLVVDPSGHLKRSET